MKRLLLPLFLLPALCIGAPFDLLVQQRNIGDSATATRTVPLPAQNTASIFGIDPISNLPALYALSGPLGFINGQLMISTVWTDILNRPTFATVATSGDYGDLINKPSVGAQVDADWSSITSPSQILNKPTTLSGYGITDAYPATGNPSSFITQAGARSAVTLTTTGTAGAATYNSTTGALNIPSYAPGTGTVTSVTAGTGLSGGVIATSGTISMPNTGTAGSYSGVTTDSQGRVSSGTARAQVSATRALNAAFQVSATRDANVQYSVQTTITASIAGGQDGDVFLDIASDSGFTTNVQSLDVAPCSQTYTLAVALQGVQKCAAQVRGYVPASYYVRLRTVNNTGTPAFLFRLAQEVLQ